MCIGVPLPFGYSHCPSAILQDISVEVPQWLADVEASYCSDPVAQSLLTKLSIDFASVPHFVLKDNQQLKCHILSALHCSTVCGYSGIPVTTSCVKSLFAWPKMKLHVQSFMNHYQVCVHAKPDRAAYSSKLHPLLVPLSAWHTISLDFIEGLPHFASVDCIMVVVDKFTSLGILS